MIRLLHAFVASFLCLAALAGPGKAADGFEVENLVLYQVDEVLRHRVPSVEELGTYYKELEKVCQEHFARESKASNLVLVIAVKPGKQSKIWFIPSPTKNTAPEMTKLREKLETVTPLEVHGGPFAFAMRGKIAGGVAETKDEKETGPPIPEEWKTALKDVKGQSLIPDAPLSILWPGKPGENQPPTTPTEFVTQVLEPTGGKIERPKDWHYDEDHGKSYTWTLSLEDTTKGPYTTGVRLQCFSEIQEANGQTAKEFMEAFVKQKTSAEGVKVVKNCDPQDQGMFTRICLETEEGPHHILYSLFWGNGMDIAVVSIAGTAKELWHVYAPVFDRMNKFELIDMKRFDDKKK